MSTPFFQGNINDFLNIAGAGQGSFILGQLMRQDQEQQKANLSDSLLNQMIKKAELEMKQQQFPLDLEAKRANIESTRTNTGLTQEQIQDAKRKGSVFDATGGASGAARRQSVTDQKALAEAMEKFREAVEDHIINMDYTGPNMIPRLTQLATETQMPEFMAQEMLAAARSPEEWKKFQDSKFENSKKGRELRMKAEEARQTALAVQQERNSGLLRAAAIRAAAALQAAKGQDFEKAAQLEMQAAQAAREAGDEAKALSHEQMANLYVKQAHELAAARARAGAEGKLDVPGTQEQGKPVVRGRQAPQLPYPEAVPPGQPQPIPPMPPGAVRPR